MTKKEEQESRIQGVKTLLVGKINLIWSAITLLTITLRMYKNHIYNVFHLKVGTIGFELDPVNIVLKI